ncbi:MAG: OmpH family outer membrane protein [Terriglobia bacterium]
MRNTACKLAAFAIALALPAVGMAQSSTSADVPTKIAVINIQQAISATEEGKKALADIQKKYEPRRADLQQQDKEIAALQDQLQNQSTMLSDDERYHLERELDQKQRHFKAAQEDAQADFQADTQEVVRVIGQKMVKLIGQYAQEHHYALVIGDQQVPVYYAAKTVDITQDIVGLYNRAHPVASASNTGSAAPAASTAARARKP